MNDFVLKLVLNAAWQVPLCGLIAWCAGRLLRPWPAVWTVVSWRIATGLAALLPVLTALWIPPVADAGFRISVPAQQGIAVPGQEAFYGASWFALAYLAFVAVMAIRLIRQWRALSRLDERTARIPLAYGWSTPRIILPERFTAEAPEIARTAAIAHETTHLRHRDFRYNLILESLTLPISFHPALVWMKRCTVNAVEMRCDEDAARETGNAKHYLLGLIEAARVLGTAPSPRLTLGFFDHNSLEERIMNLTQHKSQPRRAARIFAAGALAIAGLLVAGVSTGFSAQSAEKVYKVGESGVTAPKLVHKSEPKYPPSGTATGTTLLSMEIAPNGKAENVVVKRSLEAAFDQSAVESVKTWTFTPGMKDGQPVRVLAMIEVHFKRK